MKNTSDCLSLLFLMKNGPLSSCQTRPFSKTLNTALKADVHNNEIMITVKVTNYNSISQESYNKIVVDFLQLHQISCQGCKLKGTMVKYGKYERKVKFHGNSITLRIQRLMCTSCGGIHAVLLSSFIPYWQLSITLMVAVLKKDSSYITDNESGFQGVDDSDLWYAGKKFSSLWEEKLNSMQVSLETSFDKLVLASFSSCRMQFMQKKIGLARYAIIAPLVTGSYEEGKSLSEDLISVLKESCDISDEEVRFVLEKYN